MKIILTTLLLFGTSLLFAQNPTTAYYYKPIKLTGKLMLKTLIDRATNKPIKKKLLVFVLSSKVKFISSSEDEITTTTNVIRVYQDGKKPYIALLNKLITVDTKVGAAASIHYPLDVNIMEDFPFKIVQ